MKNADKKYSLRVPDDVWDLTSYVNLENERRLYALCGAVVSALFFASAINVFFWEINGLDFIIRGLYFCFGNLFFPDAQYFIDANTGLVVNGYQTNIHRMYEYWISRGFYSRLIFCFVLPAIFYGYFIYSLTLYRIKKLAEKMKSENDVKGGTE